MRPVLIMQRVHADRNPVMLMPFSRDITLYQDARVGQ